MVHNADKWAASRRDTLIIVGNGLTLEFRTYAGSALEGLNPSSPLGWDVRAPGRPTEKLMDVLPQLKQEIDEIRRLHRSSTDFAVVDQIVKRLGPAYMDSYADILLDSELRHYLALAYATFQIAANKVNLSEWRWHKYFRANAYRFIGACSFNYDTVLERSWKEVGIGATRICLENEEGSVPIAKPHGSMDFDDRHGIALQRGYPLRNATALNNISPLYSLRESELLSPRGHVELVPPARASQITEFSWVADGYKWIKQVAPSIRRCIFIGLSYWPVDKPELDTIFHSLRSDTQIVVANPSPHACVSAARRHGYIPEIWRDGPEDSASRKA